jgi:hypothetical protein
MALPLVVAENRFQIGEYDTKKLKFPVQILCNRKQ